MTNNKLQENNKGQNNDSNESIRLNKYLSDAGVCSRRQADRFIEEGKVKIGDKVASMGDRVLPEQTVYVNGKKVEKQEDLILIAYNKPRGIVCTTEKKEPNNIIDYINYGKRIYPIGRLDKDSEGLILLTNNGEIVNKILRGSNHHEKEYIVKVNKPITRAFLRGMISGVPILDTVTKPCEITTLDKYTFQIILTQGLNRQIRRMCEYFEYRVLELKRIRIMNIKLGRLNIGGYRNVTDYELQELNDLVDESSNDPAFYQMEEEGILHDNYQEKKIEERKKTEIKKKEVIEKRHSKKTNKQTSIGKEGQNSSYHKNTKNQIVDKYDNKDSSQLNSKGSFEKKNGNDDDFTYSKRTKRLISKKNRSSNKDAYKEIFNGRKAGTYQRKGK